MYRSRWMAAALGVVGLLNAVESVPGQGPLGSSGLLFTPRFDESSDQCPGMVALNQVRRNEVQYVLPNPSPPYGSQQFVALTAYNTMIGDHDGDGDYWEPDLFADPADPDSGALDALLHPVDMSGQLIDPLNAHRLFVSCSIQVDHSLGAAFGWPLGPGDVARILPSGLIERFISAQQVRRAFGITGPVDVDAIAYHYDQQRQSGAIYLSFEDDELTSVAGLVQDGAILRIPATGFTRGFSGYDGATLIATVMRDSGQLILTEAEVDMLVIAADVADTAGAQVVAIGDTDGLELDPLGSTFGAGDPNLLFCGSNLEGGAVLTTYGGGKIAVLETVELASHTGTPTTGAQVGLLPGKVRSLDGLAVNTNRQCNLVADTPDPSCGGCVASIEVGGGVPTLCAYWLLGAAADAGPPDPTIGFMNACFPEVLPFIVATADLLDADGCGQHSIFLGALAGWHVTWQVVSLDGVGNWIVSTPVTIDL